MEVIGDTTGETCGAPAGGIHGDGMEVIGDATGETRGAPAGDID